MMLVGEYYTPGWLLEVVKKEEELMKQIKDPRTAILESETHAQLQDKVTGWLHLHGFHVAGFRPGMNRRGKWETAVVADGKGFPDLSAIRIYTYTISESEVVIEIKTEKDKLSQGQKYWQEWFREARILYLVLRTS